MTDWMESPSRKEPTMTAGEKLKAIAANHGEYVCGCKSDSVCHRAMISETLKVAAEIAYKRGCVSMGCGQEIKQAILAEAEALKGEKERG